MAGFNHDLGRSNNMLAAEERGQVTVGRWAKKYGVTARAAVEVMNPSEAHHTGTGRRGKSRLTPVINESTVPTAEQLEAMKAWDRGERPTVRGWYVAWVKDYSGPYGRLRNIPTLGIFCGDCAKAPKGFTKIFHDSDWESAQFLKGHRLQAYANSWKQVQLPE
jgi:hypothetical protein